MKLTIGMILLAAIGQKRRISRADCRAASEDTEKGNNFTDINNLIF